MKKITNAKNIFQVPKVTIKGGRRNLVTNKPLMAPVATPTSIPIIIAGNVATREMTEALILAGADIVKVGIGPGSVCTTRKVAGVGYPQLSAISECADAAHGLLGHVMADGGCSSPGDVAKAFAAGADFVMLGGMFAGHDESGGEIVEGANGKMYKSFYGMSSTKAMETHYGEVAKQWKMARHDLDIGFIESISSPFCGSCTRARISSNGKLFTCLFSEQGYDLLSIIRMQADEHDLSALISDIWNKRIDRYSEDRKEVKVISKPVEMSYIGG